jgi:hypothetical protein
MNSSAVSVGGNDGQRPDSHPAPRDGDDRACRQVVCDRWQVRCEQRSLLVGCEPVGGAGKNDRGSRRPAGCGQELAEITVSGDDRQGVGGGIVEDAPVG